MHSAYLYTYDITLATRYRNSRTQKYGIYRARGTFLAPLLLAGILVASLPSITLLTWTPILLHTPTCRRAFLLTIRAYLTDCSYRTLKYHTWAHGTAPPPHPLYATPLIYGIYLMNILSFHSYAIPLRMLFSHSTLPDSEELRYLAVK